MSDATDAPSLDVLRARVRALEAGDAGRRAVLPLGPAALDACLPGGGLPLAGLHEIAGERAEWDGGVALGFALALLSRVLAKAEGPLLWVGARLDLHAPGLAAFGIDPARLALVRAGAEPDRLWALEEGLRAREGRGAAFAAVLGEVATLDRTAGRRLQLAAEAGGLPCFVLRRQLAAPRRADGPSAALTRWRVAPLPSAPVEPGFEEYLLPPCGGVGRNVRPVDARKSSEPRRGASATADQRALLGRISGPACAQSHPHPQDRAAAFGLSQLPARPRMASSPLEGEDRGGGRRRQPTEEAFLADHTDRPPPTLALPLKGGGKLPFAKCDSPAARGEEDVPAVPPALATALARLPGRPRWRVELLRCRGAAPADFLVEWNDATGDFGLLAPLRDGSLEREPAPTAAAPGGSRRLAG